ncbi:MAG: ribosome recycling factor [Gammaproteobacteria bacterium]|nr:MAG: ribosome recycling factor [Gammaproteobacteria bacterium]
MDSLDSIIKDTEVRMGKSIESLDGDLGKVRTGRAHASLLDHILVDYYGTPTPVNQVASISSSDARTLTVTPWEKNMVSVVEKAIIESDLGINPATAGHDIRLPMPPLTEERRKELAKLTKSEGENAKIAIRNIRRDANNQLKALLKDKDISEDDDKRAEDVVQKLTDKFIAEVDKHVSEKEKDIMEI